jgi:hypothetical protein
METAPLFACALAFNEIFCVTFRHMNIISLALLLLSPHGRRR